MTLHRAHHHPNQPLSGNHWVPFCAICGDCRPHTRHSSSKQGWPLASTATLLAGNQSAHRHARSLNWGTHQRCAMSAAGGARTRMFNRDSLALSCPRLKKRRGKSSFSSASIIYLPTSNQHVTASNNMSPQVQLTGMNMCELLSTPQSTAVGMADLLTPWFQVRLQLQLRYISPDNSTTPDAPHCTYYGACSCHTAAASCNAPTSTLTRCTCTSPDSTCFPVTASTTNNTC